MILRKQIVTNGKTLPDIIKRVLNLLKEEQRSQIQISEYLSSEGDFISHEKIYQDISWIKAGVPQVLSL